MMMGQNYCGPWAKMMKSVEAFRCCTINWTVVNMFYFNLIHVACVAHIFIRIAEVRDMYSDSNK